MPTFDLLAIARRRARHQRAGLLLDPPESRYVVVRTEEDSGLARARLRREIRLPLDEPVRPRREPPRHLGRVAVAERSLEHGKGQPVDLDEDDARPSGADLLTGAPRHPLDHAQRVRVVVVDAECDLERERGGRRDERSCDRPAERVDGDRAADPLGGEPENGCVEGQNDHEAAQDGQRQADPRDGGNDERIEDPDDGGERERAHDAVDAEARQEHCRGQEADRREQPADQAPPRPSRGRGRPRPVSRAAWPPSAARRARPTAPPLRLRSCRSASAFRC